MMENKTKIDLKNKSIQEALDNGCGYDAPGSFAAWLSKQTPMHAFLMPGKRYDMPDEGRRSK